MSGLLIIIGNYIGGILNGNPAPSTNYILSESGDFLITELGGDNIIREI